VIIGKPLLKLAFQGQPFDFFVSFVFHVFSYN